MAALSIRSLDDEVVNRLRMLAAEHGRSMEAEVRAILAEAVGVESGDLFTSLLDRFDRVGGVELTLPRRAAPPRAADFTS